MPLYRRRVNEGTDKKCPMMYPLMCPLDPTAREMFCPQEPDGLAF
jgi:hypothetical protein